MYTVNYFIKKFEKIPNKFWCVGDLDKNGKHCALGHCGVLRKNIGCGERVNHKEGKALAKLLKILHPHLTQFEAVYKVNDSRSFYKQPTPKQRILAALYDIKAMQEKQSEPLHTDITKSLAVLPIEETSDLIIDLVSNI